MDWNFWLKIADLFVIPAVYFAWRGVKWAYNGLQEGIERVNVELKLLNQHVSEQNGRLGKLEVRLDQNEEHTARTEDRLFEEISEVRRIRAASNG